MAGSTTGSGLEGVVSERSVKEPQKQSKLKKILDGVGTSLNKGMKFIFGGTTFGAFDAVGGGNLPIFARIGAGMNKYAPSALKEALPFFGSNFYEGFLVMAAGGLAVWSLYDRKWSKERNLLNLIAAPLEAVVIDYSSAAISKQNLDALPLSPADYTWRYTAYGNSWWSGFTNAINAPSHLIPGAIQGYDFAIYAFLAYLGIQTAISARSYFKNRQVYGTKVKHAKHA